MVFTNDGIKEIVVAALSGGTVDYPTHIAVGTDSTAQSEEDTALGDEKVRLLIESTTTGNDTVEITALLLTTQQNGESLREVGAFSASSGGVMCARSTHSVVTKTSSIEVEYVFTFKITN